MRSKLRVASRYLTTKAEKKSKNAKSPKCGGEMEKTGMVLMVD